MKPFRGEAPCCAFPENENQDDPGMQRFSGKSPVLLFGRIFCPGFFEFAERKTVSSGDRVSSFGGGAIWAKADGI
ncbi:MAG: hypothetical protein SPD81_02995 [Candidatus Faecousia sp.]|nr:hypothetical protein [Candidatus Faecousia sp.]